MKIKYLNSSTLLQESIATIQSWSVYTWQTSAACNSAIYGLLGYNNMDLARWATWVCIAIMDKLHTLSPS